MSHPEVGKIIDSTANRDAIHVAIAPVMAMEILDPGQHVYLVKGSSDKVVGRGYKGCNAIGIVDPFLRQSVAKGKKFYVFLYPNTVTGLRHDWTHPAFPDEEAPKGNPEKSKSRGWLQAFADDINLSYDDIMSALESAAQGGEGHCFSVDTLEACYDRQEEMWRHYEIVTGKVVTDHTIGAFHCAC